jgi:hypothetical protein
MMEGVFMPAANENATTSQEPITNLPPSDTAPTPPGGVKAGEKQYEFKAGENRIIGALASKMHFVGLFLRAMGLLVIAIGVVVVFHAGPIVSGTLACLVGLWTQRASASLRNVVQTEGNDVSHLMDALDDLHKLYSLQYWLLVLAMFLALAGLVAAFLGYIEIDPRLSGQDAMGPGLPRH